MKSKLVHIGVRATDVSRSIVFWRDLLRLEVVDEGPQRYDLTDGLHNFRVFQHDGASRPPHVGGMVDYVHLGIRVPDLVEAFERFKEAGAPIESGDVSGRPLGPGETPAHSFKVSDPDGIVVDVTADPHQWPGTE